MKARERILSRIRRALLGRPEAALPGLPESPPLSKEEALSLFVRRLLAAGAMVAVLRDEEEVEAFKRRAAEGAKSVYAGKEVPLLLVPELPAAPPEEADLGVSLARLAVAETGSLVLSSREGRRGQLLVPRHLVWVYDRLLVGRLREALALLKDEEASLLALHSGPSKSADIGQIMVKGVHGPGELWVGVIVSPFEAGEWA